MKPSVSIVTVTLNSARHVRQAIESVVAQATADLQYIVVDGQSSDDTVAIVESFRPVMGDRLVVVSEPDAGLYDAMNKGIGLATGDVIGILNSDDEYVPGALEAVTHAFRRGDVDIVYGNVLMVNGEETWVNRGNVSEMRDGMSIDHPGCFVRRSAYERWGRFDTHYRFAADYDFLLRCFLGGARFAHVDRVVARFEYGGKSSRSFDIRRREVFAIHARQLGFAHARWRQARLMTSLWVSALRRGLIVGLIGKDRYQRAVALLRGRRVKSV